MERGGAGSVLCSMAVLLALGAGCGSSNEFLRHDSSGLQDTYDMFKLVVDLTGLAVDAAHKDRPPPDPRPGYVWSEGHYAENEDLTWSWQSGTWLQVRPGFVYVQGQYGKNGERFYWIEGYWRRPEWGYVYCAGDWIAQETERGTEHVWVPGTWQREKPRHLYVGGTWQKREGKQTWRPGGWRRDDGRYAWRSWRALNRLTLSPPGMVVAIEVGKPASNGGRRVLQKR